MEGPTPFGRSRLWDLQRRYFLDRGPAAWQAEEVPDYITTNPFIAASYAEVLLAFRADRLRLEPGLAAAPIPVLELGAGSGRFAFHLLTHLARRCAETGVPPGAFRYLLTDIAGSTLGFWRAHPRLRPFFEAGILDAAPFDLLGDTPPALPGGSRGLEQPLVVIANYVLDGIPTDLFRIAGGACHPVLATLTSSAAPDEADAGRVIAGLRIGYVQAPPAERFYAEPSLRALLEAYRTSLRDSLVLVPAEGFRGLKRLASLSRRGAFVLLADKGPSRLADLDARRPPQLTRHGSLSLDVNLHALTTLCELEGGIALRPGAPAENLEVAGLLMVPGAEAHAATRAAFARAIGGFGPDAFFRLTRAVRERAAAMPADEILAHLALGRDDPFLLRAALPRLRELAPDLAPARRAELLATLDRCWEGFFPIGPAHGFAEALGALCYALRDDARAIRFFRIAVEGAGATAPLLFNLAACHRRLGETEAAIALLREALEADPGHQRAAALLAAWSNEPPVDAPRPSG